MNTIIRSTKTQQPVQQRQLLHDKRTPAMPLKTRQQIRDEFAASGVAYSAWARARGYSPNIVIAIVNDDDRNPRLKCLRGDAHNIAVELGLKRGHVFKSDAGALRLSHVA